MKPGYGLALGMSATLFATLLAGAASAATTIDVSLWDKGTSSLDTLGDVAPMGMAMGGDMSNETMGITATPATVPAGEVTFKATDESKDIIHEMILAPVKSESQPLPYDTATMRVDEEAAKSLGEVSELDPGKSGALTVNLKPGEYILYCNIPGHYEMGMWTTIKVQ